MWYYTKDTVLLGKKCLRYKQTKEYALAGKYGEVWVYNDEFLCARVVSHKVANKLAKKYSREPNSHAGDETVIKFPVYDLNFLIKTLKIPKSQKTQLRYMESVLS